MPGEQGAHGSYPEKEKLPGAQRAGPLEDADGVAVEDKVPICELGEGDAEVDREAAADAEGESADEAEAVGDVEVDAVGDSEGGTQTELEVAPTTVEDVPAGHGEQTMLPERLAKVFAGHCAHAVN